MGEAVPPAAVHAEGIVKRFGATVALDRVGITVAAGDSHALVGRNGAGKSTLVSVLTGLHTPDAGRVSFQGEPAPPPATPPPGRPRWRASTRSPWWSPI